MFSKNRNRKILNRPKEVFAAALFLSANLFPSLPAYAQTYAEPEEPQLVAENKGFVESVWSSITGSTKANTPKPKQVTLPNGYFKCVHADSPVKNLPKFSGDSSGNLEAFNADGTKLGTCALKHTDVQVHVSGFVASVVVKQQFHNPFNKKIEAQYAFPLSSSGAVDDMTMQIGDRTIRGTIKKKQEAHAIYNEAKALGQVASLLDQEKPNMFTQYVANIEPGKNIDVTLHYVDILPFESGFYSFAFPTVIGPRFLPPGAEVTNNRLNQEVHSSPEYLSLGETATAINPKYSANSGHDLSLSVDIDAGVPVNSIYCPIHSINVNAMSPSKAHIELSNKHDRPNRDFVLSWKASSNQLQGGYFTECTGKNGYLSMMMLPPARVTKSTAAPKEMIFIVDKSGSQSGAPLEKAKETLAYIVENMNPNDTFQILSFSSSTESLFQKPEKATPKMKEIALSAIHEMTADGGTYMADAVKKACSFPADQNRIRIVTMMTDGFIGNDMQILSMVRETRGNARWFSFGTGNNVNRFLIEKMAQVGGGESDIVLLSSPGNEVAKKFYDRISSPVLTDVKVSFKGLDVIDVMPHQISDVWAERPLYINARYKKAGRGQVILDGFREGKPYRKTFDVTLPAKTGAEHHLAQVWARSAVDELMDLDWNGVENGRFDPKLQALIEELGVRFHIMTQFTSFVAVDRSFRTAGGAAITTEVPAEVPDGVDMQMVLNGAPITISQSLSSETNEGPVLTQRVEAAPDTTSLYGNPYASQAPYIPSGGGGSFGDAFSSQGTMGEIAGGNNTYYNTGAQTEQLTSGGYPVLQGATNGSIGPQGGDAVSIMGVNTAGTVTVKNELELSDSKFDPLKIGFLYFGILAIAGGIIQLIMAKRGAVKLLSLGFAWLAVLHLFWPALVPWSLWLLAGECAKELAKRFSWARAKKAPTTAPSAQAEAKEEATSSSSR